MEVAGVEVSEFGIVHRTSAMISGISSLVKESVPCCLLGAEGVVEPREVEDDVLFFLPLVLVVEPLEVT